MYSEIEKKTLNFLTQKRSHKNKKRKGMETKNADYGGKEKSRRMWNLQIRKW